MRRLYWSLVVLIGTLVLPVIAAAEPPTTHEILIDRPSGFWTSNMKAPKGGEYRWRLLGIGAAIALFTGWMMWRAVKRANAARRDNAAELAARYWSPDRKPAGEAPGVLVLIDQSTTPGSRASRG